MIYKNNIMKTIIKSINWTKVAFFGIPAIIVIITVYAAIVSPSDFI